MMQKIGAMAIAFGLVAIIAAFVGILMWLIWPHVIPAIFPNLVDFGYISRNPNVWTCLGFSFLVSLIGSASRGGSKKS
jgi:hypothetical protein